MDTNALSGIFDNGLSVGIVIALILFLYFKFWPWYTERQDLLDVERKERHEQYMDNMQNQTHALDRLGDITESFAMSMSKIDERIVTNHADLVARLDALRVKRDTGPLGKIDTARTKEA